MTDKQAETLIAELMAHNSLLRTWLAHLQKREEKLDAINQRRLARVETHEEEEWQTLRTLHQLAKQDYLGKIAHQTHEAERDAAWDKEAAAQQEVQLHKEASSS